MNYYQKIYHKKYYEKNKEKIAKYHKKYYTKKKEKLKKYCSEKKQCIYCNASIGRGWFARHCKTLKHVENVKYFDNILNN
jgi:hypothetical protein